MKLTTCYIKSAKALTLARNIAAIISFTVRRRTGDLSPVLFTLGGNQIMIKQFSELIGNRNTVTLLQRGAANRKLKNLIILHGKMGTGKSSSAMLIVLSECCENPNNGEPCLKCPECLEKLEAFTTGRSAVNVVKKNIPALSSDPSNKSVRELVREIFEILQNPTGKNFYILEEADAFKHEDQKVFLEYINGMSANTYVIMTAMDKYKLLPELRSRGKEYSFLGITEEDAKILLDKTADKLNVKLSKESAALIIRNAKGVPRDIVESVKFVKDNYPTEDELREYLGFVSNRVFIDLLQSMNDSMFNFVKTVNGMLASYPIDLLISQFKVFILNCVYWHEDQDIEFLSKEEGEEILKITSIDNLYKIGLSLPTFSHLTVSEEDFRMILLKARLIVKGKSKSSIFQDNKVEAVKETIEAANARKEEQQLENIVKSPQNKRLDLKDLAEFTKRGK